MEIVVGMKVLTSSGNTGEVIYCGGKTITVTMADGKTFNVSRATAQRWINAATDELIEFEEIDKAMLAAKEAQFVYRNIDGTEPAQIMKARYRAMVSTRKAADKAWETLAAAESLDKLSRFALWRYTR